MDDVGTEHLLAWLGPDPARIDAATVRFDGDRLTARGTSTTAEGTVSYHLRTGPQWVTELLDVRVADDGGVRSLELRRDAAGWSATRYDAPSAGEPVALQLDLPDLGDALDCDLALCPVTNTMPVLRAGLVEAAQAGEQREASFVMAWVSLPDLEVSRSDQFYAAGSPVVGGGGTIRFTADAFVAHIEFDRHGLVINYPSIGRRVVTLG